MVVCRRAAARHLRSPRFRCRTIRTAPLDDPRIEMQARLHQSNERHAEHPQTRPADGTRCMGHAHGIRIEAHPRSPMQRFVPRPGPSAYACGPGAVGLRNRGPAGVNSSSVQTCTDSPNVRRQTLQTFTPPNLALLERPCKTFHTLVSAGFYMSPCLPSIRPCPSARRWASRFRSTC